MAPERPILGRSMAAVLLPSAADGNAIKRRAYRRAHIVLALQSRRTTLGTSGARASPEGRGVFDGRPRGAVGQRPEPQSPVVAQLLSGRRGEARGLKVPSLRLGSPEPVMPWQVASKPQAALDRPDGEAVGRSERAGLCWKGHQPAEEAIQGCLAI